MSRTPRPPLIWALLDHRTGNQNQVLGVAEALDLPFETREVEYSKASGLPNLVLGASFAGITRASRAKLVPPWPDVVLAAGRRCAPIARKIKRANNGGTFLVQLMYPGGAGLSEFGLIAAPRHGHMRKATNVIVTTGAPHRVTPGRLDEAAEHWAPQLVHLPHPLIAILMGGSTRRRRFAEVAARRLGRDVAAAARATGGALLISTSRRTGSVGAALLATADAPRHVFAWGAKGENPFMGYLALADAIIVTGDSASMCTEACAALAPVYVFAPPETTQAKHARLHAELYRLGLARPFEGRIEPWTHPPLNPAAEIAREIRRRLAID